MTGDRRKTDAMKRYHIEKNTVQETLIIPLYGRKVCSDRFPGLFSDPEAERLCGMLDYDFSGKGKRMESGVGLFGTLEVAQRQYDLACEVRAYLKDHPAAAVVNLGCGLDDTFRKCDNGLARGFNIDLPEVIAIRNELQRPRNDRNEEINAEDHADIPHVHHADRLNENHLSDQRVELKLVQVDDERRLVVERHAVEHGDEKIVQDDP